MEILEDRLAPAATITVNTIADGDVRDDMLSLREAILVNNRTLAVSSLTAAEQAQVSGTSTSVDTNTIAFNIPGAGVQTISPTSALPTIPDPVIIDGYTQPGAQANTNAVEDANGVGQGVNSVLLIELDGTSAGATVGLKITGGNSVVRGLAINRFQHSGIWLNSSGNLVAGNFIGTNAAGDASSGNGSSGVFVDRANNTIGGEQPADRNVISGNANGVLMEGNAQGRVLGNLIGTSAAGDADLGNTGVGVHIRADGTRDIVIGGTATGARNVISGNNAHNIFIFGTSANAS